MNQLVRLSDPRHWNRALAIAIACGSLLVVVPSCIPNLRGPDAGPPMPGGFPVRRADLNSNEPEQVDESSGSTNSAMLRFEEFFTDPYLLALINQGLAGNQEQKLLIQDVQIAYNQILARQGAFLPFVTVGGNTGITKESRYTIEGAALRDDEFAPGKFFSNPHGDYRLGANLYWQVDIWRQLRDARDAAINRYLATNEGRNYAVTRLVAEIADNYYQLLALDQRLLILDQIIRLQEQSRGVAEALKEAARGTELAVQRFEAEVRRNQSEKLLVNQEIIEVENRINFLVGRFPQPVERASVDFISLTLPGLSLGVPPQLLQNRPDIRQAERDLVATGFDVRVARKTFYPRLIINGGVGYRVFNPQYLFFPQSLAYNLVGELVAPVVNRRAIQSEFLTANAGQLRAIYNYQRIILNAFTEVINRMSQVENYGKSIEVRKQQLTALELSVNLATQLFQQARADYVDVLFAQRDLMDARTVLVRTKQQQLSAIVNTYQALGGGNALPNFIPDAPERSRWLTRVFHHWGLHGEEKKSPFQVLPLPPLGGLQPPPPPPGGSPQPPPPPAGTSPFQPAPTTPPASTPEPAPPPSAPPATTPEPAPPPTAPPARTPEAVPLSMESRKP